MEGDGGRLEECRLLEGDLVGELHGVELGHADVLGKAAELARAHEAVVLAEREVAALAVVALHAGHEGHARHAVSRLHARDPLANLGDRAGELMAQDVGEVVAGGAEHARYVGAADAGVLDLHEHLARLGRGLLDLLVADVVLGVHDAGLHGGHDCSFPGVLRCDVPDTPFQVTRQVVFSCRMGGNRWPGGREKLRFGRRRSD